MRRTGGFQKYVVNEINDGRSYHTTSVNTNRL